MTSKLIAQLHNQLLYFWEIPMIRSLKKEQRGAECHAVIIITVISSRHAIAKITYFPWFIAIDHLPFQNLSQRFRKKLKKWRSVTINFRVLYGNEGDVREENVYKSMKREAHDMTKFNLDICLKFVSSSWRNFLLINRECFYMSAQLESILIWRETLYFDLV